MFKHGKGMVNLLFIILATLYLCACDQKSLIIQPEHLTIEELHKELDKAFKKDLNNENQQGLSSSANNSSQSNALIINSDNENIFLTGNSSQLSKAISIAKRLDKPHSYYLEVRNTPKHMISTMTESMQILLHPDQTISLGHFTLTDTPWRPLIKEHERYLQLHLNTDLILTIDIKSPQNKQSSFYSGRHPMQLNQWFMAFNNSEMNRGNRIITSKPKTQLWLRLIKANNQSIDAFR